MLYRLYETNDFDALLALQQRLRPPAWLGDYPAAIDLHEILAQDGPRSRTRLWFDGADLVAYALVDDYNNLLFELDHRFPLEDEVITWAETCLGEMRRQGQTEADATLDASCRHEDTRRMALLTGHGFEVLAGSSLRFRYMLEGDLPAPALPPGFSLTHAAALGDDPQRVERIVALHRASFGTDHMTVEERQSIMSTPDYNPALDLFIVAPDGRLAGYVTCTVESETPGIGYTDPIAVHPDFHRLGLGKALLLAGLAALKRSGIHEARFTTSSENTAMQALGAAAGFELYERITWLAKQVA